MNEYKTVKEYASETITERKSEFIGFISPVSSEEDALAFISEIKKKHTAARHAVYAYILRENNIARFTDDGEPHGTAGLPILELLRKENLTDVAVVVIRYFGGILLGTGGLLRAYTSTVKAALDKAQTVILKKLTTFSVTTSYSDYKKVEFVLKNEQVVFDKTDYGTDVTINLAVPTEEIETVLKSLRDITGGKAEITITGERYGSVPDRS